MLFVVDFDGTLSVNDSVDALLNQFADPEWRLIENDWLDGKITAVDCMRRQINLVRADHIRLTTFFRGIQLDASFLPFWQHVRHFAEVAIVSDGLDHAIAVAMRGASLPALPVFANKLHFVPQGLDLSFPHLVGECPPGNGVCKCAVSRELADQTGGPVVLIGDGKSDFCLAGKADVVFAKHSLARHCDQAGIKYHSFQSFSDVLAIVKRWPAPATLSARTE